MKIVFFGTPDFVIPIAQALLDLKDHQLTAVVTNPDRPVGRKQILTPSPIKQWALKHNIPVLTPNILDDNFKFQVSSFKFQVGILAAYGKIIPQEVINLFPKGILVIHPSLLPIYRGASPIQTAILNGDKETGVSILQMDEKMDHGPIVAQFKEKIAPADTAETLTRRLFLKTAGILSFTLCHPEQSEGSLANANLDKPRDSSAYGLRMTIFSRPQPQNHSLATFTKLLTKDNGFIEWPAAPSPERRGLGVRSSKDIYNFIRAMTPWPGAWSNVVIPSPAESAGEGSRPQAARASLDSSTRPPRAASVGMTKRLKILKAHLKKEKLILDEVQLEGKKPVSWKDFQKAYREIKFSSLNT